MLQRKKLVLGTPEWKSTPWQVIPKNLKDVLVDVLVDIPGLLEDFDNMQSCTEAGRQEALRLEVVEKCWEHDGQLLHWFGRVVCQADHPGRRPVPTSREKDAITYVAVIHGMTLFWTACLVVYSILSLASGPEAGLPDRTDPRYYARKLAEAIPILLHPSAGLYGLQSASLPLEIALRYTTAITCSPSRETDLLMGALRTLKANLGTRMPRFVGTVTGCGAEAGMAGV